MQQDTNLKNILDEVYGSILSFNAEKQHNFDFWCYSDL